TRWLGASKSRVVTISLSDGVVTFNLLPFPPIAFLLSLSLEFVQVLVQPVVALLPEAPVPAHPLVDLLEWSRLEPSRPPLPLAASRDEPRHLEHLQVPGDRGKADREGFGQLGHGGLADRQPRQDRPPGGIGESCERPVELLCRCHSTPPLNNQ